MHPANESSAALVAAKLREAVALHSQGQLSRARELYEEILRVEPRHFDALHLSGVIAAVTGDPRKAVELIGSAIEIDPRNHNAYNNQGAALQEAGNWEAALASYDRAIALKSDYAEPHYNRGNVLKDFGRWDAALASYDRAIALQQDHAQAHSNRGIVLVELKRWEEAVASYDRAIALRSNFAEAHYNRAIALCGLRQWDAALAAYDRAIALKHDYAEAYSNRGFVLHELQRHDESLASCDRAIAIKPDYSEVYCNRGGVLLAARRVPEALASYDRAIALKPDRARGYVNRALALLLAGEYEKGWADHEWRWKDPSNWLAIENRNFPQPLWLGQDSLVGKTILLQSEQGYGDTIQFCRYAKLVADRGAEVILEVPTALSRLLQGLSGVSRLVVHGEPLPPFDYYCPLLSLPLAMKTMLSSVPAQIPYLKIGEERLRHWSRKLGEQRERRRVGLVWSGGFRQQRPELWSVNNRRNIPLANFTELKNPEVEFYSLQKGQPAESELAELIAHHWDGPEIKDFTGEIHDFSDTAAFIEQLDLVISVDTSTVHLAGALGKPVWILNRFDGCWRWLLDRTDSPWYPTARLYRQERPGEWDRMLRKVARDLAEWSRP